MYKKLLYGIAAITALFFASEVEAQIKSAIKIPIEDSLMNKGHIGCGTNRSYIASLGIPPTLSGGSSAMIIPPSYPAYAKDTCGYFEIYYDDIFTAATGGFNAGSGVGLNRQDVLCSVLTYIQSVYDFSSIPTGQYIRLQVASSYYSGSPAPTGTKYCIWGSPYYDIAKGVTSGYVQKFVQTATDPKSGYFHAQIKVNFDKIYFGSTGTSINYYESTGSTIGNCQYDLSSALTHAATHAIGWFSNIGITKTPTPTGTILAPIADTIFSRLDSSINTMTRPFMTTNPFATLSPLVVSGTVSPTALVGKNVWVNQEVAPYNHAMSVDSGANLDHFVEHFGAFSGLERVSPCDRQDYIMSPFTQVGVLRRNYNKGELETLHNIVGYAYNPSFSGYTSNHVPWSSKMNSDNYNLNYYNSDYVYNYFPENMEVDFKMRNNIGDSLVINLSADTSLHDADGDTIRVDASTLVNHRGCGDGNNHSLLTLTNGNRTIIYKPRQNFYGRAQFSFNLSDNKEKGGMVVYTIDVAKGTNVSVTTGDEIVVNGDFEQGSEIKRRGAEENIPNTLLDLNNLRESKFASATFEDGHPMGFMSLELPNTFVGNPIIIGQSAATCDTSTVLKYEFGQRFFSYPHSSPSYTYRLGASPTYGNRYINLFYFFPKFFYLADTLKSCHRYNLEFDAQINYIDTLIFGRSRDIKIGFSDSSLIDFTKMDYLTTSGYSFWNNPTLNDSLNPDLRVSLSAPYVWEHQKLKFNYCAARGSDILTFKMATATLGSLLIDNVSIKEDTSKLLLSINDSLISPCNNHRLWAKARNFSDYVCVTGRKIKYYWTAGADTISRDSIIYVSPKVSTKYTVAVFDGCDLIKDSINVIGSGLEVVRGDDAICYGDTTTLTTLVKGATGTVSYSWSPSTGLSCTTCASPKAYPTTSTTYTLTVTDSLGCFKQNVTVLVHALPISFVSNDTAICIGRSTEIIAQSLDPHVWASSSSLSCTTCDTAIANPTSTTAYFVTFTNRFGCVKNDTVNVLVNPLPTITITATPPTACGGAPVSLTASGGIVYSWQYSPYLTCIPCSTTMVSPPIDETFTVAVTDINGCMALDTILVKVRSKPMVHAIAPAKICQFTTAAVVGMGAKTYTWATLAGTTTGIACPTCPATTITLSTPTSYVVTGTDSNGCTGKDTFFIDINPLPTIGVTTPIINACANDTVNLTATGGISYVWSPSAGISCTTCNPTKAKAPSSPYTYVVTGTDANGCKNTATATITTGVCPCTPASVFGTSATTLSGTIPATISSGYYYLPNNITISSNTVMTGAKILIERGVTITVDTNAKLTLDNCHLFTCDEDTSKAMWRGIVLASTGAGAGGSSGRIEVRNNCLIEDAMFAIDAINLKTPLSGNVIDVSNSTFNRNQVDISMNGYKVSSPAILPISIKSNLFTARKFTRATMIGYPNTWISTATLKAKTTVSNSKPPYAIVKTYPSFTKMKCKDTSIFSVLAMRTTEMGQTSSTGVYQSEVKIGEGGAVDDYNLIDNHQYGFLSYNSNVTLLHNHFINISRLMNPIPYSPTAVVGNGMAVLLQSSKTSDNRANVIMSAGGNLINKFHDCFMGIYTENIATLSIQNTEITKSDTAGGVVAGAAFTSETYSGYGMMLHCEGIQKSTNISSNTLSNVNVGIQFAMVNPKTGHTATILNNTLSGFNTDTAYSKFIANQCMSRGIDVYSSGGVLGTANTMSITNNTISKVFNGISFQGLTNVKCSTTNNSITLWDTSIASVTALPLSQYGIQCYSTNEATISGNSISTPTLNPVVILGDRIKGLIAGSNTNLRICSNTTTNIGRGFEFAKGYDQTGTRWIGNTMTNGYKGMVLASNIGDQGFMYNWVTMPWAYWGATLNKWNIVGSSSYHTYVEGAIKSSSSKLYVRNIPTGMVELPSPNWGSPPTFRYLYTGTPTGTIQIGQQESNCLGSILPIKYNPIPKGGLIGVKTLGLLIMADSLGYDSTYNVRQWMSQLSLYELGTIDPELRDSSAALDSFMNEAGSSRFAWLTNIEKAINSDDLTTAQNLLDNPVSAIGRVVVNGDLIITDYTEADEVVENYTNYYTAYLQFLQGTMTDSDSARIWSIAHKCPVKDGAVVYKARALQQRLSFDFIVYNDDSCEYNNGSNYRIAPDATITGGEGNNAYTLFPNPNNGSFVIKQSIAENKAVNLKVYNAIGSLVYQSEATFVNGQISVKLGQKAQGVYLVCIGDDKERTTCLRFIIN